MVPTKTFQVSLNVYAVTNVEAYDEDNARDIAACLTGEEITNIILDELSSSGVDIGTIEMIEEL